MAPIVSVRDVVEQMDLPSEATAYINRKTGELITLAHENQSKNEKNLCNALGIEPTSPKRCSRVKARLALGALGTK